MIASNLDAAIAYTKRGYPVLPVWSCQPSGICRCPEGSSCKSPGKHPQGLLAPKGHKSATTDVEIIRDWYTADPEAGIAIYPGGAGLVVMDIDPRNHGDHTLLALLANNKALARALDLTVHARTQGGGDHYFFRATPGVNYLTSLGPGIDIKHEGYVCVEPTLGRLGPYKWTEGRSLLDLDPIDVSVFIPERPARGAEIPAELIEPPDEAAINDLREALHFLDHNDYHVWISTGHALKTAGTPGHDLWIEWSKRSAKFHDRDAQKTWASFTPNQTHWKAIFKHKERSVNARIENFKVGGRPIRTAALQSRPRENVVSVLDRPIQKFTAEEVAAAKPHPPMLIEKYLYADLRNLVAAGGVGKTTLLLHEAVMGALGRSIWGRYVPEPFTTVIVTKEDSRELIAHRIGQLCNANYLSQGERAQVFERVYAIDLCGQTFRLAKAINTGIRPDNEAIDQLVKLCIGVNPARIVFDPLISFGAGEAQVNDSEQAIVEAARYILNAIPGCAIDVIHHTGKQSARANQSDQYAGRNGTALPDGSRMVAVLNEIDCVTFRDNTGIALSDHEVGLRLTLPKLSYCEKQPEIFIRRQGFLLESVALLNDGERAKNAEASRHARLSARDQRTEESLIAALIACGTSEDPRIRYPSRKVLLERPEAFGKTSAREQSLERLIGTGAIHELPLSAEQIAQFVPRTRLGGRKTYFALSASYE